MSNKLIWVNFVTKCLNSQYELLDWGKMLLILINDTNLKKIWNYVLNFNLASAEIIFQTTNTPLSNWQ